MMKKLLFALAIVGLLCVESSNAYDYLKDHGVQRYEVKNPRKDSKNYFLGHAILDIEHQIFNLGTGAKNTYGKIDAFINRIVSHRELIPLKNKKTISRKEAETFYQITWEILKDQGFLLSWGGVCGEQLCQSLKGHSLVDQVDNIIKDPLPNPEPKDKLKLMEKILVCNPHLIRRDGSANPIVFKKDLIFGDCDIVSFMYFSAGEALGLPISFVLMPFHALTAMKIGEKEYFYWEGTSPANNKETNLTELKKILEDADVKKSIEETGFSEINMFSNPKLILAKIIMRHAVNQEKGVKKESFDLAIKLAGEDLETRYYRLRKTLEHSTYSTKDYFQDFEKLAKFYRNKDRPYNYFIALVSAVSIAARKKSNSDIATIIKKYYDKKFVLSSDKVKNEKRFENAIKLFDEMYSAL